MKKAILLHGTNGSDKDYFWFADTKSYLKSEGYDVWWPLMPGTECPSLAETLAFLRPKLHDLNHDSIIIGHSSACPVILALLQELAFPIRQAILVAGFYRPLNDDGASRYMLPDSFDWQKIRNRCFEIIMINSDDDPWGCTDDLARPAAIVLGASLILNSGQGHMGSRTYHQPYAKFDLLKRLLPTHPRD